MRSVSVKTVVIWVLVVASLVGVLGFLSSGFTNSDVDKWIKQRNPNNLLDYTYPLDTRVYNGLNLSIDEYGVIRVGGHLTEQLTSSGTPKYIQWSYHFCTIYLPAGKYTLSCGGNITDEVNVTGQYVNASTGKTVDWYSDSPRNTVIFTEPTQVKFSVRIMEPGIVHATVYPILNSGANPIDYFTVKTIGE